MFDNNLSEYIVKLDHTAIAVRRIKDALALYRDVLGGEPHSMGDNDAQGFRWFQLIYPGGSKVELLEPLSPDGFLAKFLDRYGEGVHHMTFKVNRIEELVPILRERGLRVVDENYSDPGWKEALISPRSAHGTIVQIAESNLSDEDERRLWKADVEKLP